MRKLSKLQLALQKGDEKLFPRDTYPPIQDPEIRPPDARLCKVCHGIGWYTLEVPHTDERFAKRITCTHPDCQSPTIIRRRRTASLLQAFRYDDAGDGYDKFTFSSWMNMPLGKQSGKEIPLLAAKRLAQSPFAVFTLRDVFEDMGLKYRSVAANEDSPEPSDWQERLIVGLGGRNVELPNSVGNWLVLEGVYGSGKTGLACAILNSLRDAEYYGVFVRLPDYIEAWQRTYGFSDQGERLDAQRQLSAPVEAADVLLVDEVNVVEDKEGRAHPDKIRILMDYIVQPRWSAGTRKPTIFTTNKPYESFFAHWGDRIATRVLERAHWLRMGGEPLRHRNYPIG